MDFVRKAVRAIGRCAIKVEVGGDDVTLSPDALLIKSLCRLCSLMIQVICSYLLLIELKSDHNIVKYKKTPFSHSRSVFIMNTKQLFHYELDGCLF